MYYTGNTAPVLYSPYNLSLRKLQHDHIQQNIDFGAFVVKQFLTKSA